MLTSTVEMLLTGGFVTTGALVSGFVGDTLSLLVTGVDGVTEAVRAAMGLSLYGTPSSDFLGRPRFFFPGFEDSSSENGTFLMY